MLKVPEFKIIQSYVKQTVKIVFQGLRRENYKSNIDQCLLQSFLLLNKMCLVNNFLVNCQIIFRFSRKILNICTIRLQYISTFILLNYTVTVMTRDSRVFYSADEISKCFI